MRARPSGAESRGHRDAVTGPRSLVVAFVGRHGTRAIGSGATHGAAIIGFRSQAGRARRRP